MDMSLHKRESLGYWRGTKGLVADKQGDKVVFARAVHAMRVSDKRNANRLRSMANKYSALEGQPVEMDTARAACMFRMRAAWQWWDANGGMPTDAAEQIREISLADYSDAATDAA